MPDPNLRFAEAALDALDGMDDLLAGSPDDASAKASFADLHAYAMDPTHDAHPRTLTALLDDAAVRADFQRLLANTSRYFMPRVAAASSGALRSREAEGCRLVFRPSRADANQMYVIIESTADPDFHPKLLFVSDRDGQTRRLALPEGGGGRVQVLLERDSEIAQGLLDINTEVYLT